MTEDLEARLERLEQRLDEVQQGVVTLIGAMPANVRAALTGAMDELDQQLGSAGSPDLDGTPEEERRLLSAAVALVREGLLDAGRP